MSEDELQKLRELNASHAKENAPPPPVDWKKKYNNLKKGFDLLMEYWDSLPVEAKAELEKKLKKLEL